MQCPNCNAPHQGGYICRKCNINMIGFAKAIRVSKALFNKGLSKANQGELSTAIEILNQSIRFNKHNHVSRNLLGLLYCETGQIGDALKQWIISTSMVKTNNHASLYIQKVQNNPTMMHSYNDAVATYNKALPYIAGSNLDMAVMQLRKAIELNPSFLVALNLLAFCFLLQNNKEEATRVLARVLEIDKTNPTAIRYHMAMSGKPPKSAQSKAQKTPQKQSTKAPSMYHTVDEKPPTYSFISLSHMISFTLGGVLIAGMAFFFVLPNMVGDMDMQISNLTAELHERNQAYEEQQDNNLYIIQNLESENSDLAWQLESLGNQVTAINQAQSITDAQSLMSAGQVEEAADILYDIDITLVPQADMPTVQALMDTVFFQAAYRLYNTGLTNYNQGNFELAMGFFERSLRFAELNNQSQFFIDDTTYFLGRIAQEQGNYEWAIRWFTYVIEDHPNSNMFNSATARLAEVIAAQTAAADAETEESE